MRKGLLYNPETEHSHPAHPEEAMFSFVQHSLVPQLVKVVSQLVHENSLKVVFFKLHFNSHLAIKYAERRSTIKQNTIQAIPVQTIKTFFGLSNNDEEG